MSSATANSRGNEKGEPRGNSFAGFGIKRCSKKKISS